MKILKTEENKITAVDELGSGGAYHEYHVTKGRSSLCYVRFQKGPVKEFGVNGCQNEDILAIVIDRLECFQAGDYACEENARALQKIREGLDWLQYRTRERAKRGVEGKLEK